MKGRVENQRVTQLLLVTRVYFSCTVRFKHPQTKTVFHWCREGKRISAEAVGRRFKRAKGCILEVFLNRLKHHKRLSMCC